MSSEDPSSNLSQNYPLTVDQQHAYDRLVGTAYARVTLLATIPPGCVPARWSVPVLSGPAGCGKTHVCQEVARRLGNLPCERWEVGSWAPAAFRASNRTRDQLHAFMQRHPEGSVVYLAGVEALITKFELSLDSYGAAVLDELTEFLDQATARSSSFRKQDNNLLHARVLVVVGGCFEPFGSDPTMRDVEQADWWKFADQQAHFGLPARLRRRLASCPLVLGPPDREEAAAIAARILARLPAAMDGIDAAEIADALRRPRGWHAITEVFERFYGRPR